jgi:hypothetical protein
VKIILLGSLKFRDKFTEHKELLKALGHTPLTTKYTEVFLEQNEKKLSELRETIKEDFLQDSWDSIKKADSVLVLNFDKRGVKNYIGGSTLMELGYAHILDKKIYLLNPIPQIPYFYDEILNLDPVIINGDISKIN